VTHEQRTEAFYSRGVERYGTFHGNYLNFGLWDGGVTDYVEAAERLLARVGGKIGLDEGSLLLDVACGMGSEDLFFLRRFGCAAIEAIDLTAKHVAIAVSRNPYSNVNYRVGDACSLPFGAARFTHVTAIECVVHFNPREKFFHEARRVLRPDGRLGMSDFCLGRPPRGRFERMVVGACERAWHVPPENTETVDSYAAKLSRAGFTDVDVELVSDAVIPGYLAEQQRAEVRRAQRRIRGAVVGRVGRVIDWFVHAAYAKGLLAYILVSGRKGER
jgi:ubiquinone/menaquinone biosynthesis C-methylase UbiE